MFAPVKRRTPCVVDSIIHGQIVSQDVRIGTTAGRTKFHMVWQESCQNLRQIKAENRVNARWTHLNVGDTLVVDGQCIRP